MYDNKLWVVQQKTENKIAIPLNIEIENMKLNDVLNIARRLNFDYSICIKNRSSIVHPVSIFLRLA